MFVQIHMLQSMPPGNLNRDETGQPKKAIFGGVTRGRISSQCLKRNVRLSQEFKDTFGDALADQTKYLPTMVARELPAVGITDEKEIRSLMAAIIREFGKGKKKKKGASPTDTAESEISEDDSTDQKAGDSNQTPQVIRFPAPFAKRIAELASGFRSKHRPEYDHFIGAKELKKEEMRAANDVQSDFINSAYEASKTLTVDIGLFGRMTTGDLVANVEATCQVAHAISAHEVVVEDDFFTAEDTRKREFAKTQSEAAGAGFASLDRDAYTFYDSAVYYKYFNLDLDSLQKHLPGEDMAKIAETFLKAAAFNNPTGKQNSFAAHGAPEFILIEIFRVKRPISYANAFLQPVEGGVGKNLMTESADALCDYIDSAASAFTPSDTKRLLLVWGKASDTLKTDHSTTSSVDELAQAVGKQVGERAR